VTPREYRRRICQLAIPDSSTAGGDREDALIRTRERPSVVVVDDDEGTRDTIGRYMESSGFSVTVVSSGRHFLDSVARVDPDAVFLDYRLPDMDGVHCLRESRQLPGCGTLPVLLFSADWELELREAEWKPLGARYLSKLCGLEELLDAVERVLRTADVTFVAEVVAVATISSRPCPRGGRVLEAGEIVELGSHDALLARQGKYRRMWDTFSPGFAGVHRADSALRAI
jgi:DNA-binding response OmpR family regulator